jgi:hypothetical protein
MRGAERPGKVRWTRPFLPPLEPLSRDAALQTLFDIVGDDSDSAATKQSQIDQALDLTDNLPLALTLLGALISLEGYAPTITRWHVEHTALLSDGPVHTSSNLNHSIALSLSGPRIVDAPVHVSSWACSPSCRVGYWRTSSAFWVHPSPI